MDLKCACKLKYVLFAEKNYDSYYAAPEPCADGARLPHKRRHAGRHVPPVAGMSRRYVCCQKCDRVGHIEVFGEVQGDAGSHVLKFHFMTDQTAFPQFISELKKCKCHKAFCPGESE